MKKQELQEKLGANIVKVRLEKGLKQYELADKLEIEDSALRRIEKGRTNISVWLLKRIPDALEISIAELMKFD